MLGPFHVDGLHDGHDAQEPVVYFDREHTDVDVAEFGHLELVSASIPPDAALSFTAFGSDDEWLTSAQQRQTGLRARVAAVEAALRRLGWSGDVVERGIRQNNGDPVHAFRHLRRVQIAGGPREPFTDYTRRPHRVAPDSVETARTRAIEHLTLVEAALNDQHHASRPIAVRAAAHHLGLTGAPALLDLQLRIYEMSMTLQSTVQDRPDDLDQPIKPYYQYWAYANTPRASTSGQGADNVRMRIGPASIREPDTLPLTFVHEAAHTLTGERVRDHAYKHDRLMPLLAPEFRVINADSYMAFVRSVLAGALVDNSIQDVLHDGFDPAQRATIRSTLGHVHRYVCAAAQKLVGLHHATWESLADDDVELGPTKAATYNILATLFDLPPAGQITPAAVNTIVGIQDRMRTVAKRLDANSLTIVPGTPDGFDLAQLRLTLSGEFFAIDRAAFQVSAVLTELFATEPTVGTGNAGRFADAVVLLAADGGLSGPARTVPRIP